MRVRKGLVSKFFLQSLKAQFTTEFNYNKCKKVSSCTISLTGTTDNRYLEFELIWKEDKSQLIYRFPEL